jgi:hypothetical protein
LVCNFFWQWYYLLRFWNQINILLTDFFLVWIRTVFNTKIIRRWNRVKWNLIITITHSRHHISHSSHLCLFLINVYIIYYIWLWQERIINRLIFDISIQAIFDKIISCCINKYNGWNWNSLINCLFNQWINYRFPKIYKNSSSWNNCNRCSTNINKKLLVWLFELFCGKHEHIIGLKFICYKKELAQCVMEFICIRNKSWF